MAQTLVRKVMLKLSADDGDTEAKLDKIAAKADELAAKHPELKVRIDTAAAAAKVAVLRQELKDVGKTVDVDVRVKSGGLLSKIFGSSGGGEGGGGSQGLISKLLFGESGGAGGLGGIPVIGPLLANPFALAGVLAALMAIGTEVGALATGLTAAGLGAGSFAALAYPAIKQVTGALGDTKAQLGKLPAPVQQAVGAVKSLENGFKTMAKAFEPTVFKVMNQGLGIASQLLPWLGQFATAVAPAIEGVFGMISSGMKSDTFGGLMSLLVELSGPVITAVGSGMKGLAKDIAFLMERFSKKDVINSVNIAFRILGGAISLVTGLIMEGMIAWDFLTQKALPAVRVAFDVTRHAIATAGHDIAQTFDTVRHGIATDGHIIATDFDKVRHSAATLAHDIAAHFDEARHDIAQWAGDARHDVNLVISFFEGLPGKFRNWFDQIRSAIAQKFGQAVTFVKGVPGQITGALVQLPGQLYSAGKHAVSMFISGLKSIPVVGTVIGWGQDILDHLPRSPAKKGPLSGAGSPDIAGRKLGLMFAAGMQSSIPAVSASSAHLARAAGIGVGGYGHPGYGGGGGAQKVQLELNITGGNQAFRTFLKKSIRTTGGDVSIVGA